MRIAIPVADSSVCGTLEGCEALRFYEDDHGKIVKTEMVPLSEHSADAAIDLLEKRSADVLVCSALPDAELRLLMLSGIMFSVGYEGLPDEAALAYLRKAIVFDPNNSCNACGHGHACSMSCDSCAVKLS